MGTMLHVIDSVFTSIFTGCRGRSDDVLSNCHVFAANDRRGTQYVTWRHCVDEIVENFRAELHPPSVVMVLGHMPVFADLLPALDALKWEVRVPQAERELATRLRCNGAVISVAGFHKETPSEIWQLLENPRQLAHAETFARLRSVVEDGGGPRGRVSALKHDLMRPFTSIRLRMELELERGKPPIDQRAEQNICTAIAEARTKLETLEATPRVTDDFRDAVRKALTVCDTDVYQVTSDPMIFNQWIDTLNAALDRVRQKAC